MKFDTIDYLRSGTEKQRLAYKTLTENEILTKLRQFDPILVGTIPINVDIAGSDLDIICSYKHEEEFANVVKEQFGQEKNFTIQHRKGEDYEAVIANFYAGDFEIEIFGQAIPTRLQNAYRHMLIEDKLLNERGESFRQKIIALKQQGHKTEPAFGILLNLRGNPYIELLTFES